MICLDTVCSSDSDRCELQIKRWCYRKKSQLGRQRWREGVFQGHRTYIKVKIVENWNEDISLPETSGLTSWFNWLKNINWELQCSMHCGGWMEATIGPGGDLNNTGGCVNVICKFYTLLYKEFEHLQMLSSESPGPNPCRYNWKPKEQIIIKQPEIQILKECIMNQAPLKRWLGYTIKNMLPKMTESSSLGGP